MLSWTCDCPEPHCWWNAIYRYQYRSGQRGVLRSREPFEPIYRPGWGRAVC